MAEIRWYKVRLEVPGTDGDAENGPCEPMWWDDMEQAHDEEAAVRQANDKARRQWEETNYSGPGAEVPSDRDMGQKCPVCTGASPVTDEEYEVWKREVDAEEEPFNSITAVLL